MAKMAGKKKSAAPAKKVAKKKPVARKVKKKAPARASGGTKRGAGNPSATNKTASPVNAEATRLGIVVEKSEQALEKASKQLADARERVARAEETARLKRTGAALAVADRARDDVAVVNKHRLDVVIALRIARDAVSGADDGRIDWDALEQTLNEALERYEEVLGSHDRRVHRRARERRNR